MQTITPQKQNKAAQTDLIYSSAALYQIPREELLEMLEEENLDKFEKYLCLVEEGIFDSGPLSARRIEEYLQIFVSAKKLDTMREENLAALQNNPWQQTLVDAYKKFGLQNLADEIETGQLSDSPTTSFSEAKNSCQKKLDDVSETITAIRDRLKQMQRRNPQDHRIASLLERIEQCENEIDRIRGIVESFR
jgi:hypothetical protein